MPHGEEVSNTLVVKVAGTELPADVAPLLVHGMVDESSNVPNMFVLRFNDEQGVVVSKGGFRTAAEVELLVQSSAPGPPQPLLKGEVTTIEVEVAEQGMHTVVRGLDKSHRLFRGTRVEAYLNMTASDIASRVAQRAKVPVSVEATRITYEHIGQAGVSDWDFLQQLARDNNRTLELSGGTLMFRARTPAQEAPSSRDAREEPLTLERGVNLLQLRGVVTTAGQVPSVEVRGWDPQAKREVVGQHTPQGVHAQVASTPTRLAGDVDAPAYVHADSGLTDQTHCTEVATSLADHLGGGFAELEGTARGNPKLHAGVAVSLVNVGDTFSGKYTLSGTRHEITPDDGYLTRFVVSNTSERSLYGAASGASARGARIPGVVPAIVTNAKDPENRGRVKVKFPFLSDAYESTWARPLQPGAGPKRGITLLPEVGDEVLVAFGQDEFDQPYVLGGLYNGQDVPEPPWSEHVNGNDGSIKRRGWTSRTGMELEFVESPQEEKLTVSTNAGTQRVTLVQNGSKGIQIISEGPVEVTAKTDVTVSTSSGNVSLKGMNVTVEAQNALDLKGVNVKVAGSATSELSGGATTTVKGAMVRIN